jgi:hypothetical protein
MYKVSENIHKIQNTSNIKHYGPITTNMEQHKFKPSVTTHMKHQEAMMQSMFEN